MSYFFSIIIPCYNCASTLKQAVDSVFTQELEHFEIVMVDDGSTDNTRALMHDLAAKHKEIKLVFHEKNRGGGAARNTGIKESKGDIIFCLDSDNILSPKTLGTMANYLLEKKADGIGFYERRFFHGNNTAHYKVRLNPVVDRPVTFIDLFNETQLFLDNFVYTRASYLRTDGYPEHHGFDTQSYEMHYLATDPKVYICPNTVFYHRQADKKKSYFEREYESGAFSKNYYLILEDILPFLGKEVCLDILSFDIFGNSGLYHENLKTHLDALYKKYPSTFFTPRPHNTNEESKDTVSLFLNAVAALKGHSFKRAHELCMELIEQGYGTPVCYYNLIRSCVGIADKNVTGAALQRKTDEVISQLQSKRQVSLYDHSRSTLLTRLFRKIQKKIFN